MTTESTPGALARLEEHHPVFARVGMQGSEAGLTILSIAGAVCGAVAGVVLGARWGSDFPDAYGLFGVLLGSGLGAAGWAAVGAVLGHLSATRSADTGGDEVAWGRRPAPFALAAEYCAPAEERAVGDGRGYEAGGVSAARQFDELDEMRADFLRLSSGVEGALSEAVGAVLDRDPSRADRVVAGEAFVDELDGRLEDRCYRILLLYHPVACDLRLVTVVARMSAELERLGDLAVGIARRAVALAELPAVQPPAGLRSMADSAVELVRAALGSYLKRDPASARLVCRTRDAVVGLGAALTDELVATMKADPRAVEPGLHLLGVVQSLRRVAERATNLAEDAVFLAEGQRIRHHWDAGCLTPAVGIAG